MDTRHEATCFNLKRFGEDLHEPENGAKSIKTKDLNLILKSGGMKKCSKLSEYTGKENVSQITDTNHILASHDSEPNGEINLSLGLDTVKFSSSHHDFQKPISSSLSLDLNDNPLNTYKNLEQMAPVDVSECGSTTGPIEKTDPLKVWNEMKRRSFLSSSPQGCMPASSKFRNRQPKRKKEEDSRKKVDSSKREPPAKHTRNAAPTGLLSGLNPGIIKHVRNSKQVNSIIEAMLKSEKNNIDKAKVDEDVLSHNHESNRFGLSLNTPSCPSNFGQGRNNSESDFTGKLYNESYSLSQFMDNDDDPLTLKLSSDNLSSTSNNDPTSNIDLSASHDIASLSIKGASMALQWLDILQQDIKGRLASLKRSRKRVKNVIQVELPYLTSKESLCDGANLTLHMEKWRSVFSQMDKSLHEEGKHLESWLSQVLDMHSHCEGGLKFFSANRAVLLAEEFRDIKKGEDIVEKENAIRAAAASIHSTCNMIMTKEKNVPCF